MSNSVGCGGDGTLSSRKFANERSLQCVALTLAWTTSASMYKR